MFGVEDLSRFQRHIFLLRLKPPAHWLAIIVKDRRFQVAHVTFYYQAMRVPIRQVARVAAAIEHRDRRIETAADSMSADAVSELRSITESFGGGTQLRHFQNHLIGKNVIGVQRQDPLGRQRWFGQRKIPLRGVAFKVVLDDTCLRKALHYRERVIVAETIYHDDLARPAQLSQRAPNIRRFVVS